MEFTAFETEDLFARSLAQQMADHFNDILRKAKAEAWDEGYRAGHPEDPCSMHPLDNPYRD